MEITPGMLQLAAILVAPIAALAGVWSSPYLTSRLDRRRWLRERRAGAYVGAIEAAESIRLRAILGHSFEGQLQRSSDVTRLPLQEGHEQIAPNLEAITASWNHETTGQLMPLLRAESELSIFGDEATYNAMRTLISALLDLWIPDSLAEEDIDARRKKAYKAEMALINLEP